MSSTDQPRSVPAEATAQSPLAFRDSVRVVEVGLRDGLQSVTEPVSTMVKLELVKLMIASGVTELEIASFAHPKVLPQLADAEELLALVPRPDGVRYRGLVPNLRGAERAADCGLHELVCLVSCDEQVSVINQGRGTDEVLAEIPKIAAIAEDNGARLIAGVAMAFFSPCVGKTDPDHRAALVDRVVESGAQGIYLADTVGMANPRQVFDAVAETRSRYPDLPIGLHLHTRNGFSMANVLAGLMAGVDWFESAFGGLGGDLWFPGDPSVLGNLATEDLVAFADSLGVSTGVDGEKFTPVTNLVELATGRPPLDHISRGGSAASMAALRWEDILKDFSGKTTTRGATGTSS